VSRFASGRDAKEFLVARIVVEAQREGVSLAEIERKMLYFSETDWTLPDIDKVSEAFEREYDNDEYEKKIRSLIHNARVRARKEDEPEFEALVGRNPGREQRKITTCL
jgi:SOS response regulatory protein OraA/RecX